MYQRICPHCRELFATEHPGKVYCSRQHKETARKRRALDELALRRATPPPLGRRLGAMEYQFGCRTGTSLGRRLLARLRGWGRTLEEPQARDRRGEAYAPTGFDSVLESGGDH